MDDNTKRTILQSILSSQKIKNKYLPFRNKHKLNRRLIIERIINEIDTLAKRFKDNIKLLNFLEKRNVKFHKFLRKSPNISIN
jgi:hypothetical protein